MGRIGDAIADGPLSDAHFVEPVQRINRDFLAYQPQTVSPEVAALPLLAAGHFTFGSFNALPKISAATVSLWSAVLHAVPGSRILIKTKGLDDPTVAEHLLNRFYELGIEASRIDLAAQTKSIEEHLDFYNKVDIALDTIPYNGTTTTCESLWMGVPVFSVLGKMHHERVSASILNTVGLSEFVGETQEDMVKRVVNCCADITALASLRASLRDRVSSSPLCDGADLARQIEPVYRKLWIQALGRDV